MSEDENVTERELLPCPFCGGKPQLDEDEKYMTCSDCIVTMWTPGLEDLKRSWNTRANERLQSEDVSERDKLFDEKTCQASDEYIRGWEDSRAFSAKMERAAKEIDAPDDDRYTEGYQDAVREMRAGWISVDERLPDGWALIWSFPSSVNPKFTAVDKAHFDKYNIVCRCAI